MKEYRWYWYWDRAAVGSVETNDPMERGEIHLRYISISRRNISSQEVSTSDYQPLLKMKSYEIQFVELPVVSHFEFSREGRGNLLNAISCAGIPELRDRPRRCRTK